MQEPSICHFVRRRGTCLVAVVLSLVVSGRFASAQATDPNVVQFIPPAEHSATLSNGQPVVSRYDISFFQVGAAQAFMNIDLGKPAPQADGVIRVDINNRFGAWPMPNVPCDARVTAIGPNGTNISMPSSSFVYTCTPSLSSTSQSLGAAGGTGSTQLTTGTHCGWQAVSSAAWLTITSAASGVGSAGMTYTAAANTATSGRSATIAVGGLTYTVTQAGTSSQANVPPTVRLTQPVSGSTARMGPPLKITAEASDADSGIAGVEFYADGNLIQTVTSAPYTVRWKLPSAGTYTLTAVAQDTQGARTTSSAVSITTR